MGKYKLGGIAVIIYGICVVVCALAGVSFILFNVYGITYMSVVGEALLWMAGGLGFAMLGCGLVIVVREAKND